MPFRFLSRFYIPLIVSLFALSLSGCQIDAQETSQLEQIKKRGVLRIGTLNNQLSYYIGPDGPTGLEYELAERFAKEIGVKLEIKPAYRLSGLFPALESGQVDIVAAGISQSQERLTQFRSGPAYYYVSQQVVYKNGTTRPRNLEQLIELDAPVSVVADSHLESTLNEIRKSQPTLNVISSDADTYDLLKQVSTGDIQFTVANSVDLSLAQRVYPNLSVAFDLTEDKPITWYTNKSEDEGLYALMIEFFGHLKQSGELAQLEEKYLGHVTQFDYVDTRAFVRAIDSTLPKWEPLFKKHAGEFDWRLISAVAYQESHWNPSAKSPTGVRGMMMLTLPTAKSVGVTNRLDPEQSIEGGVKYLRQMVKRIPDSIAEHEKTWFALASYNVGFGHMMDARRLTKAQGANPDLWSDVKERLPLLRQKKYYSQTRYGFARGDEAMNYVENIRRYYQSIIGHVDKTPATEEEIDLDNIQVIQPIEVSLSGAKSGLELTENPAQVQSQAKSLDVPTTEEVEK
jgi:membrane-bound lytic murein transglycosylase F